jgi:hypothetical protein
MLEVAVAWLTGSKSGRGLTMSYRSLGGSLKGQTRQYGILFPAHFLIQMHERWSCKIALVDIFLWLVCLGHRNGARGRSRPLERRGAGDRYTAQRHQRITLTLNQSRLDCFTSGLIAVARLTQGIRPSTALRPFAGERSFGGMSNLHKTDPAAALEQSMPAITICF